MFLTFYTPPTFLMALSFKLIVSKFFSIPEIFGLLAPCCRCLQLKAEEGKHVSKCMFRHFLIKQAIITDFLASVWRSCVNAVLIKIMSCLDKTFDF